MDFTNPAADAKDQAEDYVAKLLELLGECDPLEAMADLMPALREAVDGLEPENLRQPEAPGKWSVLDVVRHLADTELVHRYRMRKIVAQPGSDLAGYDQDAWADGLRYRDGDLASALAELGTLREANLDWLGGLTDEELEREGVHAERGRESVRRVARLLAAHDLVHLRQIGRIRASLG